VSAPAAASAVPLVTRARRVMVMAVSSVVMR
jgi:hypothetical protein